MNRQGIPLAGHGALAAPAPKKAPMAAPQPNAAPGKR
jgi:hypothetical protein